MVANPPEEIVLALRRMGLIDGADPPGARLTGGVSSDIWRIDLPGGPICVKRALAKLKVEADWRAPIGRNAYEAAWMRIAAKAVPAAVPALLGQDEEAGLLAMSFLPPEQYPVWKELLRDGVADVAFAASVAATIGQIHAATATDPTLAAAFPTDAIFYDIRLEPYLVAAGRAHPDLAPRLDALVRQTAGTHVALVHGDVSPKNILAGPDGPVFLDAECAWWGDPAFDIAFCLNHLLLKCMWVPRCRTGYLACFDAMVETYLAQVAWEPPGTVERRAAQLLPALLLARVDGKSPVEYMTEEAPRAIVRRIAQSLLADPPIRLHEIARVWERETRP
jgi:aminoglycoside phosphotransferase (APT) family kinase protein